MKTLNKIVGIVLMMAFVVLVFSVFFGIHYYFYKGVIYLVKEMYEDNLTFVMILTVTIGSVVCGVQALILSGIPYSLTEEEERKKEEGKLTPAELQQIKDQEKKGNFVWKGLTPAFIVILCCVTYSAYQRCDVYVKSVAPTITSIFNAQINEIDNETNPLQKLVLFRMAEVKLSESQVKAQVEYESTLFDRLYKNRIYVFKKKYKNIECTAASYFINRFKDMIHGPEEIQEDIMLANRLKLSDSTVSSYRYFCNTYLSTIKKLKDKAVLTDAEKSTLKKFIVTSASSDAWIVAALKQCIHEDLINKHVCQLPSTTIGM